MFTWNLEQLDANMESSLEQPKLVRGQRDAPGSLWISLRLPSIRIDPTKARPSNTRLALEVCCAALV
jgi:hypothetical protein